MKNNTEKTPALWVKVAQSPWFQGPFLGSSVMAAATPFLNWTNHTLNKPQSGSKMLFRSSMSGASAYAASAVPGYATAFAFKALLKKSPEEKASQSDELFSSFTAGGLSGLVCTPFESLAQNKFITKSPSYKDTALKMIKHHGYQSFFRGGANITLREGSWLTVYMTAIPMMSKSLQEQGVRKQPADFLAVLAVAGAYGLLSSPLNQLRFKKQQGLTESTPNKSYLEHAKDIFNQDPKASNTMRMRFFFKAGFPRSVTTTVAAGLMVKGTELYNEAVDHFSNGPK